MKKRYTWLLLILPVFFLSVGGYAQQPNPLGNQDWLNGYSRTLQGEVLPYFSVYPKYAREALLVRCTDGKKSIVWETDPVPETATGPYVYFTWIAAHSTGTSGGDRNFDLSINDVPALTFTTKAHQYPDYWSYAAADSTRLVFEFRTRDGANDAHGMMYLRVPLSRCKKGQPLQLRITGQAQQSNDWFMTFRYSFKEKVDVLPLPFLLNTDKALQPLQFTVLHFGKPDTLHLTIDGTAYPDKPVNYGFNVFEIPVPAVHNETRINIKASIGTGFRTSTEAVLQPVHSREINFIHHAHTDIGYSHVQEEVQEIHVRNIYEALRLIDKTAGYPEGSRFRWNIESAWAAENFLKGASSADRERFFQALRRGQIALAGFYANDLTGLMLPEEMQWLVEYAIGLSKKVQFPVNAVMMSDIPGMSWTMVDVLAKQGIRYFSNGPNYIEGLPDKGDRIGQTLFAQGNQAFWWKSTTGKDSLLIWTCGKGYSSWHGFAPGAIQERGKEKIAEYISELDASGYPYDMVHWRYNIVSDNGPTDSTVSDFVRDWNERYLFPKIVLTTVNEMFARFEARYGKQLPVISGDFTPYWEDGAYSTAKEEGEIRELSGKLAQLIRLARIRNKTVPDSLLYPAKKYVVLFHEHTWGAFNSISEPDLPFVQHQWNYKLKFLDSARYFINRIESMLIQPAPASATIAIANTLGWPRAGWVRWKATTDKKFSAAVDPSGKKYPLQLTSDGYWNLRTGQIPASATVTYTLTQGKSLPAAPPVNPVFDSVSGFIQKLGAAGFLKLDTSVYKGLASILYRKGIAPAADAQPRLLSYEWTDQGPLVQTLLVKMDLEGTDGVEYRISSYAGAVEYKVSVLIHKKAVREKESMHIAFPFQLSDPEVRVGVSDTYFGPGFRQAPGSNTDFYSVQYWIDVSGVDAGVTIVSPQAALFEVGTPVNEDRSVNGYKIWKKEAQQSATLFAYILNNYWHTNYKADQQGPVPFDFYLRVHKAFDEKAAKQFGQEVRQPLLIIH